jgi:hypothetical protein
MGQKPALPHRSIAVRFAPNKQTLAERVQCDAMCQNLTYALQQMTMQKDAFATTPSPAGGGHHFYRR